MCSRSRLFKYSTAALMALFEIFFSTGVNTALTASNVVIGQAPKLGARSSGALANVFNHQEALSAALPMILLAVLCWFILVIVRSIQIFIIFELDDISETDNEKIGMERLNVAATVFGLLGPIFFLAAMYGQASRGAASALLSLVCVGYFTTHSVLTAMQAIRRMKDSTCLISLKFVLVSIFFVAAAMLLVGLAVTQILVAILTPNYYLNPVPKRATEWAVVFMIPIYFAGYIPLFLLDSPDDEISLCLAQGWTKCCGCPAGATGPDQVELAVANASPRGQDQGVLA